MSIAEIFNQVIGLIMSVSYSLLVETIVDLCIVVVVIYTPLSALLFLGAWLAFKTENKCLKSLIGVMTILGILVILAVFSIVGNDVLNLLGVEIN